MDRLPTQPKEDMTTRELIRQELDRLEEQMELKNGHVVTLHPERVEKYVVAPGTVERLRLDFEVGPGEEDHAAALTLVMEEDLLDYVENPSSLPGTCRKETPENPTAIYILETHLTKEYHQRKDAIEYTLYFLFDVE